MSSEYTKSNINYDECVDGVEEYIHRSFDPSNLKFSESLLDIVATAAREE